MVGAIELVLKVTILVYLGFAGYYGYQFIWVSGYDFTLTEQVTQLFVPLVFASVLFQAIVAL